MLIRGPISRDFFEDEPDCEGWVGNVIVLVVLLAGVAALCCATVSSGTPPLEFVAVG